MEFKKGKGGKRDVQEFALDIEDHLFQLHDDLIQGVYVHSPYESFYVYDPKLRHIHKPSIRDRVLHHAVFAALESLFEPHFIFDSYSSRTNKGTHRAVERLRKLAWRLSCNNTKTVWILHGDIRKFFDSVDHGILFSLIKRRVGDLKVLEIIRIVIESFETRPGKGIPLGNLTSQLFSNIYLDRFDQFMINILHVSSYIRYADDFIVMSRNGILLKYLVPIIQKFLMTHLRLTLHPRKIVLRKWHHGVDFLGYVSFPHHMVLRTKTKRRLKKRLRKKYKEMQRGVLVREKFDATLQSYSGMFKHCRGSNIVRRMSELYNLPKLDT